jgi:hypothetical protein
MAMIDRKQVEDMAGRMFPRLLDKPVPGAGEGEPKMALRDMIRLTLGRMEKPSAGE